MRNGARSASIGCAGSLRRQHHHHLAAFEARLALDLGDLLGVGLDALEHGHAELLVGHLVGAGRLHDAFQLVRRNGATSKESLGELGGC